MKTIFNKLFNLNNNSKDINRANDLTPRGIKSTLKSNKHGNSEDFNETWKYIYSQRRNLPLAEKEYEKYLEYQKRTDII